MVLFTHYTRVFSICASLQVCWLDLDYLKVAQAAVQVSLSVLT